MSQVQPRIDGSLRKAIGRLIVGLEKRDRQQQSSRRYKRFNIGVKVHLCSLRGDGSYEALCEAWAIDISMGGIGCLLDETINQADVHGISFEEVLQQPCYIPIHIQSARMLFGNVRQIQCEFIYQSVPGNTDGGKMDEAA